MTTLWWDLAIGVPALIGGILYLATAIVMLRAADSLVRINSMSMTTGLGMVMFIISAFAHVTREEGLGWVRLVEALIAIGATFVVTSIASMMLARAAYRSNCDIETQYDDLAL